MIELPAKTPAAKKLSDLRAVSPACHKIFSPWILDNWFGPFSPTQAKVTWDPFASLIKMRILKSLIECTDPWREG